MWLLDRYQLYETGVRDSTKMRGNLPFEVWMLIFYYISDTGTTSGVEHLNNMAMVCCMCCNEVMSGDACASNKVGRRAMITGTAMCNNIKHTALGIAPPYPAEQLDIFAERYGYVTDLDVSRYTRITDACLAILATACTEMTSLNLACCKHITDAGMASLATGCNKMKILDVSHCRQITDLGVTSLTLACHSIKSLNLKCCRKITDASLMRLAAGCAHIISLILSYCRNITDAGLTSLAAACPLITTLVL